VNAVESLRYFGPELWIVGGAFAALFLDFFVQNKKIVGLFCLAILAIAAGSAFFPRETYPLFFGFFELDTFTYFFRYAAIGIVAVTLLISFAYKPLDSSYEGEYYSLFLFMCLGLILMAAATNLLMIALAVEFVSILSYLLVGFLKKDARSKEAAIKYLLFGSVASGIMFYGMSLLYGATGSLNLHEIGQLLAGSPFVSLAAVATVLVIVGLGFKISMAPFHFWAPDVYEGAPTPVTAFLTVAPKALGFAILIRVLSSLLPVLGSQWNGLISVLAILTMTIGNILAVSQTNIKRLLAYSSIAQAGYILMGVAVFTEIGITGVLVYLVAYAFTNLGAFTVVIMQSNISGSDDLQSYAGLGERSPFMAASLTIFLLSLAGIPPLAGFIGKFFVFSGAIQAGFYTLAIAAAINSAVAGYYYFKVIRMMYLVPAESKETIRHPLSLSIALGLMLIFTLGMGLAPSPVISFIKSIIIL